MAENFVNIIRDIRGSTNDPATDTSCIYGDMKNMHEEYKGFKQITDEERLKLENIEEGATKNSSDAFLLSRANHTGNVSMSNVQDTPSRMAMTIHEKNKLEAINVNATVNDTDANLRNRATHTGVQSIDTISNSPTHVKMAIEEKNKLTFIQANATKNATDAELRDRSTHTGTQSADTIVNGITNAAFTNAEKVKLAVLDITKPPAHLHDNETINSLSYGKLINVPTSFTPSAHLHNMNEITLGDLDASRINETSAQQFVSSVEKARISGSEQSVNKGIPNGYVPLDGNGKINPSYLDSLNVIDVFTPVDFEAMLLLSSAKPGDIAYVQSFQDTYMLIALPSDNHLNWKKLNSAAGVVSINGLNGVVSLSTDYIPEGIVNKYFTGNRVADEVKEIIKAGTNVTVSYDANTNELTISADTYAKTEIDAKLEAQNDASGISVIPAGNLTSTNVQAALVELQGGMDNRYTKAEVDIKLAGQNDASEINYDGTSSGLVATKVQGAIDEVENRLGVAETKIANANISIAEKINSNITVNVGTGETYTTINQALEYLSGFYPMYIKSGIKATINLKAGFVMNEQVLVSGIDLGWITIVGEDAETIITHTFLTTYFSGGYPAFGVDKGGTSPVIGQLFRFNVEKVGGNKNGLMAFGAGSSADVLPSKGFIGAGSYGISALAASTINAHDVNCSNAGSIGIYAQAASTINANGANCSNAGSYGIVAETASTINAYAANCSNAGSIGIIASSASTINAYGAIVRNQTTVAARVYVQYGSHINAPGIDSAGGTAPVFSQAVNTLTSNGIIYQ